MPPPSSPLFKLPRAFVLASVAALALASLLPLHPAHARSLVLPTHLRAISTASATSISASAATTTPMGDDHAYFRPPAAETSGFPKNTHKYHRAPCPCLNTLANHGYLPRDGKNLTPQLLQDAIMDVFNIDPSLAARLTATLPPAFTLADLGEHNFIEHDASLVHDDAFFGTDPSHVNETLAANLFAHGDAHQVITPRALAHFRADRERDCAAHNPQYDFGLKHQGAAYAEAAALLLAMGDYKSETISVARARAFLLDEQLPADFERSETAITTSTALYLAARLKFLASWSWSAVATK